MWHGSCKGVIEVKCPECGNPLPKDSVFCQYCGAKIGVQTLSEELLQTSCDSDNLVNSHDNECILTSKIDQTEEVKTSVDLQDFSKKRKKKLKDNIGKIKTRYLKFWKLTYYKKHNLIIASLAVLLSLSIALNIVQCIQSRATAETLAVQEDKIDEYDKKIDALNDTISIQEGKIESQENSLESKEKVISSFEDKVRLINEICDELSYGNVGYYSENFRASESVILVKKYETNRKFILTAYWPNGGSVKVDYSGNSAFLSFDNSSWETSTEMTIEPLKEGVTTVTFSNDINYATFKVIIIVTD